MTAVPNLYDRFAALFPDASARTIAATFANIESRYAEPQRHYHTLTHITQMLDHLDVYPVPLSGDDLLALYLAVWLHDVVYDTDNEPGVPANEYRSAQYTMVLPSSLGPTWPVKNEASRLIVATLDHLAAPQDLLVATLLDADLSILGSAPDVYANYAAAVRKEYASASDTQWAQGRSAVMLAFLSRPYIYFDPVVRANLEIRARKNITAELKELAN